MATTQVSPDFAGTGSRPLARKRSALDAIILVALGIAAVDYFASLVAGGLFSGHIIPPVLGLVIAYVISMAVVATGWRWSMILPLLVGVLALVMHLSPGGFPLYAMTHPSASFYLFASIIFQPPLLLMVVLASMVKLVQTLRHIPAHAPRWLATALGAIAGLAIGALLIGGVAQPAAGGAGAPSATGTETVHLLASTFSPNIIALHAGDTLTVVDDTPTPHVLANGSWSASNQAAPATEAGAPIINHVNVNNNTLTIGPFTTAGTYHIYCLVHPGMNLTVIVQ
jgi:plastocyanin